jgi:rhamnosyltransferase
MSTRGFQCPKIAGVVVTFNPDSAFPGRLAAIKGNVSHVVVVDNASTGMPRQLIEQLGCDGEITLIRNPKNMGLAVALNQGFEACLKMGFKWVITFDQDSTPKEGMTKLLFRKFQSHPFPEQIAFVGPNIVDEAVPHIPQLWLRENPRFFLFFQRVPISVAADCDVTMVITSGALTNLSVYERIGRFRNDFFIDYIDTEYCLRAKTLGYKIFVCAEATLMHNLGSKSEKYIFGVSVRPTFHSFVRRYYMSRNCVVMIRRYGMRFPHWLLFDLVFSFYNWCRILLLENDRRLKLRASAIGMLDGIRGRMGPLDLTRLQPKSKPREL